jgi:hypothetical protein
MSEPAPKDEFTAGVREAPPTRTPTGGGRWAYTPSHFGKPAGD